MGDQVDGVEPSLCIPYVEAKKEQQNTKTTAYIQQRNNIVSTIQETAEKYDTCTYEQFLYKVPTDEQRQLCGTSMTSYIKILIKIYNTESTSSIRSKHYYDIMMEHWNEDDIDITTLEWFNDFFTQNKIDPSDSLFSSQRLPFFPIWNWVEANEILPLKCRTFVYQFNTQIEHQTLSGLSMRKPPTILQPQHLYTHMLYHINDINDQLASTNENDMPGRNRPVVHPHRSRSRSPVKKDNTETSATGEATGITGRDGMGQSYPTSVQDGFGRHMHPTSTSNYYPDYTVVTPGTFPMTYWFDTDFSSDQTPIVIPYRNLAFWLGTDEYKGNNTLNVRKKFFELNDSTSLGIAFHSPKMSITNQATLRQRLLTQGQTSTTTWDFEGSQNLVIAHGDRVYAEIQYTKANLKPPFLRSSYDFMPGYNDQDLLTYDELAIGHTKHFNYHCPLPANGKLWSNEFTNTTIHKLLIPGRTGTNFLKHDTELVDDVVDIW
ncbi:hypothetical protein PR048_031917 [Dryococelus australis]|uniref:Capsid protein n=1 Tax=Dryococelus australis TaxID=614101 RepID=A0ABQ9G9J1_9NEOP|nr:hypothetical protein PR048_031917 [Dryococelus australis]